MDTSAILHQTCTTGAKFAGIGLLAGALFVAGSQFVRAHKSKALLLPPRVAEHAEHAAAFQALITPKAAMDALNQAAAAFDAVLALPVGTPRDVRQVALLKFKSAFVAYFEASGIATIRLPSFGLVPKDAKLYKPHAALCLAAHAAWQPHVL